MPILSTRPRLSSVRVGAAPDLPTSGYGIYAAFPMAFAVPAAAGIGSLLLGGSPLLPAVIAGVVFPPALGLVGVASPVTVTTIGAGSVALGILAGKVI